MKRLPWIVSIALVFAAAGHFAKTSGVDPIALGLLLTLATIVGMLRP